METPPTSEPAPYPESVRGPIFASLTLVLPAFNEAERIGPALDELFAYLDPPPADAEARPADAEAQPAPAAPADATPAPADAGAALPATIRVLVVDDGSTDRTAHLVLDRPEASRPEAHPCRLELLRVAHGGKGAAVRAGMLAATGEVVVFTDADMATPPDQLPLLLAALGSADVALGSRIQPDGSDMRATQPAYRRMLGRVFHGFASIWVVGPVQDTQCGFKGFRLAAAREVFGRQQVTSIVFDVEIIYLVRRLGYRMAIIPIRWEDRRGSRMRPGLMLAFRVVWDLFRIPLIHRRVRG